jgi:hypothetical protein
MASVDSDTLWRREWEKAIAKARDDIGNIIEGGQDLTAEEMRELLKEPFAVLDDLLANYHKKFPPPKTWEP